MTIKIIPHNQNKPPVLILTLQKQTNIEKIKKKHQGEVHDVNGGTDKFAYVRKQRRLTYPSIHTTKFDQ